MSSTDNLSIYMPPFLTDDNHLEFSSAEHLSHWVFAELGEGRMSAVLSGTRSFFESFEVTVRCPEMTGRPRCSLTLVHQEGDVAGFSVSDPQVVLMNIQMALNVPLEAPGPSRAPRQTPPSPPRVTEPLPKIRRDDESESGHGLLMNTNEGRRITRPLNIAQHIPKEGAPALDKSPPKNNTIHGEYASLRGASDLFVRGSRRTLFAVLRDVHESRLSGLLTVIGGHEVLELHIDDAGAVVDFSGDMSPVLVDEGLCTEVEAERGAGAGTVGLQLRRVLNARPKDKKISKQKAESLLVRCLVGQLSRLSQVDKGRFVFVQDQGGDHEVFRLGFENYGRRWVEGLLSDFRRDEYMAHHDKRMSFAPVLKNDMAWDALAIAQNEGEKRLVDKALAKGEDLRALLRFSPLNRNATYSFLMVLEALGILKYERPHRLSVDADQVLGHLRSRLLESQGSHFDALGVHPTAHESELKTAFKDMRLQFGPNGGLSQSSNMAEDLCRQILKLAEEGFAFLSKRKQRMEYRAKILTTTEREGYAQLLVDKMRLAMMRGQMDEVATLRARAMELSLPVYRREMETDD